MVNLLLERAMASGRIDDDVESIAQRLRTFKQGNHAVEEHLREKVFSRQYVFHELQVRF